MDNEKKYKELVGKIKKAYLYAQTNSTKAVLEDILPELAESEDERIRKEIQSVIEQLDKDTTICGKKYDYNQWVAWLEKQGKPGARYKYVEELLEADAIYQMAMNDAMVEEAKNKAIGALSNLEISKLLGLEKQGEQILDNSAKTGKDETKFHKGQWIVWQEKCYKVNYNGCGYELVDQNGLSTSLEYGTVDKNAHIWDITKDAKPGDVLVASDGSIFLFRGVDDSACKYYAALTADNYIKINKEAKGGYWETSRAVYPATKEQCNLLFAKMKEVGYDWDAEKKEPKKIEQKSAWSEEDEDQCINTIELVKNANDCGGILDKETALNWLKSLKERCTWKPSDEQIKAIRLARSFVVDDFGEHPTLSEILMELEEQLQKIKEGQTKNR